MSANVRGFHANVGELKDRFVLPNNADIMFVCEAFLDGTVPDSYARVRGYASWIRKDHSTEGGGVAFCYEASPNVIFLSSHIPAELDVLTLKIVDEGGRGTYAVFRLLQTAFPVNNPFIFSPITLTASCQLTNATTSSSSVT